MAEQRENQQPTFMQIVKHPITYALLVVVSVFWYVLYYTTDGKDEQMEREAKLYERIIEEVRKQSKQEITDQIEPIAKKVDTISANADSTFNYVKERMK
ncbi:hypothetical protein GQF61_04230 [Sphingobacterium sp. DK4209]|uniref:Uncharacterized protein n=1 Tax=Sphingobacterium zhuxiongii TaxID=2662364 RepID=A0A5Q0Q7E5_9SPHI|nr:MULTISPECIES: hypothetical protein [unclassified Sphingobacterium]MVZ65047.1 hypothetical protein [Sphingobacterium sp. DK4209]QGA25383.1 hypothetical protein GFH32_03180 [Sphingobacterium sp. dk4302]